MASNRFLIGLSVALSVALGASSRGQSVGPPRLLSLLSRDARMLLWVGDREACLRRMRATPLVDVLSRLAPPELLASACTGLSHASIVLPPGVIAALPWALGIGRGEMALSVEGFVLRDGVPRPDMLWVADASGFEAIVDGIINAARRGAPIDPGVSARLPFALAAEPPPSVRRHRDVDIGEITTVGGARLALAHAGHLVFGARSAELIEKAIDRRSDPAWGALDDSGRLQLAWRSVSPRPGDLLGHVNLRRLRQEQTLVGLGEGTLTTSLAEQLAEFDAVTFALRGVGDGFAGRLFLEDARRRSVEPGPLMRPAAAFRFPSRLHGEACAVFASRMSARQAAARLLELAPLAGGTKTRAVLEAALDPLGGARLLAELVDPLDGELVLLQAGGVVAGEVVPRVAFLMETCGAERVRRWFDALVDRSQRRVLRRLSLGADIAWELRLPGNAYLSAPCFALVDDWLIGASSAMALRDVLQALASDAPALDRRPEYFAPFDRLDLDPRAPCLAVGFVDSAGLVRSLGPWLSWHYDVMVAQGTPNAVLDAIRDVIVLCDDPEVQEICSGFGYQARAVDGGVLIEAAGF